MDARPAPPDTQAFPAIEDYAAVGNLETVALIASNGAVELFCYPAFDSPAIFSAALDRAAGSFRVRPTFARTGTQRYVGDTNVLVTRYEDGPNIVEVTDFMPIGEPEHTNQLVRIAAVVAGTATIEARCTPAFDYGRGPTKARLADAHVVYEDGGVTLPMRLAATHPLHLDGLEASATAELAAGERMVLVLVMDDAEQHLLKEDGVDLALADTIATWRDWTAQSDYDGPWRDMVMRSALALKLMFSDAHGAIVAAPTFGLPEAIGGERNWDYRYCWVRDSAFTIYAMLRLGFYAEADKYRAWIRDRIEEREVETIALMYRVDGSTDLDETLLPHLSGYRGSQPVRIGNAAYTQTQLDIFGEVIDTLYIAQKFIAPMDERLWRDVSRLVEAACETWDDPGSGFWEMRGEPTRFLDAHLMSWVALDRAIRLADRTGMPQNPRWRENRALIVDTIETHFWNGEIGAYTQTYGGDKVDATALLMPLMKYTSTTSERFRSTLAVIERRLVHGPRVRRYEPVGEAQEGVDGPAEGSFVACSFWYIEVLARSGRVDEAERLFEAMLAMASPTGLFAEEVDGMGRHLGNTPQALSHLALISAAVALRRAIANGGDAF
ncbi:glycoside hydrolase family 15 protein [Acuticoccus sp. I52.16.1]|uniref:glycoside hydrolase family 15 protein n=1 Tax=Acuticoccus sp. I52.16.1 TaxID=2928472 RepID=UPI001FD4194C|nr:glycoside hydrolase family 15 protein [Acuticoccus sp. I52.16.1]UOM36179.1 glycoside hydrolase family 15 protein [Acuticoccus sp. I52.16.1]